jgi:hypothetical protein
MDQQDPPSRRTLIACGALAAAAGGYVMLISLGVVPPPGEKNPHAPHWLVFCAGLAFVLAGVALGVRACAGGTPPAGCELPPDAPRWLHALQYLRERPDRGGRQTTFHWGKHRKTLHYRVS